MYDIQKLQTLISESQKIVVIQADNPDGDSLGSALALESLLESLDKKVFLYCGVGIPQYLHYMQGWSRISSVLPSQFDLSIIVDTSTITLLQHLVDAGQQGWIASRPCIVLDHHAESDNTTNFATLTINDPVKSSTGELIYALAQQLDWQIDTTTGEYIMTAILGDTQGLTNDNATADTYTIMADLIKSGVSRTLLEELRRDYAKMDPRIFKYKAELIRRTEIIADGRIAIISIPQEEINTYSPLYNPAPLIQNDMLQTSGVMLAIVLKYYDDGKILGAIRSNYPAPVASELAVHFGGGGHPHAAGFKLVNARPINEIKSECISIATGLLDKLAIKDNSDETIQHAYSTD